ncbi:Heat shock factor protein 1 [Dissostichus eleginoides]|uniref:Heat shock factor protein 1 n=1 Tax=Dissostichus eleginoides TaxID=100907 RepID=A0AAD9B3M7_DISEL|nr:Heat shock factor protein 1 [Dissostichus eleginoides]
MECPGGGGAVLGPANVPAFLTKLWTLVEDPDTDPLICWSPGRFSKEVLPKFFKHNNMASFIRQLNMCEKVVHIEQGGLVKPERDDTEFQHPFFIRGQEHLLENIKRKVTTVSSVRPEEVKVSSDDVNKILSDVQLMKGKQETIDSRIIAMRQENEALWREVASLRQKHVQQQKVVNKLIHFLVSLVQSNRVLGVKRKIPLMLNDSSSAHSLPKYSRPFSLEQAAASLFPADPPLTSGPIISDLTDVATPPADSVLSDWSDSGESQSVEVKEEPSNPVDSPVDTPLSPTTFINSILLDHEQPPLNPPNTASQSPTSSAPPPRCQTVACIDRSPRPPPSAGGLSPEVWRLVSTRPDKSELSHHVDSIDSLDVSLCFRSELSHHVDSIDSLDVSLCVSGVSCLTTCELSHHVDSIDSGLQSLLNSQALNFDPSPLMELALPLGDFDLDSLDTLLSDDAPNGGEERRQLVQYTGEGGGAYLPSLLELEAEPFFISDPPTDDPASTLLSPAHLDSDL